MQASAGGPFVLLIAVAVAGCGVFDARGSRAASPADVVLAAREGPYLTAPVKDDLALVAEARILFGHQSVGSNLLDGLTALAEAAGTSALRVTTGDASGAGQTMGQG